VFTGLHNSWFMDSEWAVFLFKLYLWGMASSQYVYDIITGNEILDSIVIHGSISKNTPVQGCFHR